MQDDALDWGLRYMTQAEWDGVNDSEERGVVAATDGRDGAPEASAATTPGGAPSRLEPGAPHTSNKVLSVRSPTKNSS